MFRLADITGVYSIRCIVSGRVYVGSTFSKGGIARRWSTHRSTLRNGKSPCVRLQNEWEKYGEGNFVFEMLEPVPLDTPENILLERESWWIASLGAALNICEPGASPMRGRKQTEEHKRRIKVARAGFRQSEDAKQRIGDYFRGRMRTEEERAAISRGRRLNPPVVDREACRNAKKHLARPIIRTAPDGTMKTYDSTRAVKLDGFDPTGARRAARSGALYKGYTWRLIYGQPSP